MATRGRGWTSIDILRRLGGALAAAVLVLAIGIETAVAAPGDLDLSFSGDGKLFDQLGFADNEAQDAVIQPDGKIVVVGSGTGDFDITRFNPDGSLDTAFGEGGTTSFNHTGGEDRGIAVALQTDGKIVAAGVSEQKLTPVDDGYVQFGGIYRVNSNGTPDTSFSGDGKVFRGGSVEDGGFVGVAIDPDGNIVAARSGDLARYTPAGVPDTTFSGDGFAPAAEDMGVRDIALDGAGRIVVVGSDGGDMMVARHEADGDLDGTFSDDGIQIADFTQNSDAHSVAIDGEGRIVAAGEVDKGSTTETAVARFEPGGDLDDTFSGDGIQKTNASGNGAGNRGNDVAVDGSDRVVVVGITGLNAFATDEEFVTVRYEEDGDLDPTFAGGIVKTPLLAGDDTGWAVALGATTVLAVGAATTDAGGVARDYAMIRYTAGGTPDPSFGGDGVVTQETGEVFDAGREAVVQPDGKTVVIADTYFGPRGGNSAWGIARYEIDGDLDPTFGKGGHVLTNFSSDIDEALDVALDTTGRIVVAGTADENLGIARYEIDGDLDKTFSGDGRATADYGLDTDAAGVAIDGTRIVVGGQVRLTVNGGSRLLAARFEEDGDPDPTFGVGGVETTDLPGAGDVAGDVAVTSGGAVVVVGGTGFSTDMDLALVRYTAAGVLDTGFSGDGITTTNLGGAERIVNMALDASGRIVAATTGGSDFRVVRYDSGGVLDTGFSGDGIETTDFAGSGDVAQDIGIASDGRILVAGYARLAAEENFALARYTTAGALDASFAGDGRATADFAGSPGEAAFAMAVGPGDTAILVGAGAHALTKEFDLAVARFLTAGGTPVDPPDEPGQPGQPGGGGSTPTPGGETPGGGSTPNTSVDKACQAAQDASAAAAKNLQKAKKAKSKAKTKAKKKKAAAALKKAKSKAKKAEAEVKAAC